MIFSKVKNLGRYLGIHENLDKAIHFLLNTPKEALDRSEGKHVIDDTVYYTYFEHIADGKVGDFLEAHKHYLDMHIVLKGCEKTGFTTFDESIKVTQPYNPERDIELYEGKVEQVFTLEEDDCMIVFPEDMHQPKIKANDELVEKLVVKVLVD